MVQNSTQAPTALGELALQLLCVPGVSLPWVVKMARLVGLVVGLVVAVRGQEEGTTNLVSLTVPTHQVQSTEFKYTRYCLINCIR